MTGFYVATTLVKVWECIPRERIWNKDVQGHCISVSSLLNTSGIFNSATDIMILLVPIKSVWRLQMSTARKVGVAAIFTVGFLCARVQHDWFCGTFEDKFIFRCDLELSQDTSFRVRILVRWPAVTEASVGRQKFLPAESAFVYQNSQLSVIAVGPAGQATASSMPPLVEQIQVKRADTALPMKTLFAMASSFERPKILPMPASTDGCLWELLEKSKVV
ncbi:MAG: hypothetical protein Q9219_002058 [cf. Caloplaca sp. 3 TL-2023]